MLTTACLRRPFGSSGNASDLLTGKLRQQISGMREAGSAGKGNIRGTLTARVVCLVLCASGVLVADIHAQTVRGVVSDRGTYEPISSSTVRLVHASGDTVAHTISNEQGYFSLSADREGDFYLIASALGYRSVQSEVVPLGEGDVKVIELDMEAQAVPIEGLRVETEGGEPELRGLVGTGFYERAAEGHGEFLFPGEILRHPAEYTPQLFREMASMVYLERADGPARGPWNDKVMIRSHKMGRRLQDRLCSPHIWIDNVLTELMPGESLDDAVPKDSIQAIEVYRAPWGAPARYFRDADPGRECGAVLIWTK